MAASCPQGCRLPTPSRSPWVTHLTLTTAWLASPPFHRRGAEARAGEHAARKRPLEAGPGPRPPGCRPQVCRKGPADTRWPSLGLGRGRRAWRSHAAAQKAAGVWALQKGCRGHHSAAPASRDGRLLPWELDGRGPRPRQRRRHASSRTSALRDASSAPLRLTGGLAHAAAVGTNTLLASPAPSHCTAEDNTKIRVVQRCF